MTHHDLLALIEEGLENGRIPSYLAAYIAAEVLGIDPAETDFADMLVVEEELEAA
jgi:hypothetical protein